jgi:hypothetical protein
MATQFDFANLGSIFGGGMGGTPTGLDALLSEDQRKLMNRNAALSAAAALLQAGGRSAIPIGLGQAFGSALQAGQKSYQEGRAGSLQDLMLGQKLQEAQRTATADAGFLKFLQSPQGMEAAAAPSAQPAPLTGVAVPPAPAPAAAPNVLGNLSQQQRALIGSLGREKGTQYLLDMMKPEASPDSIKTLRELGLPVTMANLRLLDKPEASPEAIKTLNALGLAPTLANLRQLDKPEASPAEVRILQAAGVPITLENIMKLKRSGATNVTVPIDVGQKGFENEMKLSGAFKQEPIYKDFSDIKSAYGQVVSSLAQGTPIGDVGGATKVMKLLDPGSVVRESELGIAMAAAGRMDRLQNYFNNFMTGQKLTPTQRDDFQKLSNELYSAAGQAYNKKRAEYEQFGNAYGFKNLDTALGAPATTPSVMKSQPASAAKTMRWNGTKFVFE